MFVVFRNAEDEKKKLSDRQRCDGMMVSYDHTMHIEARHLSALTINSETPHETSASVAAA